MPRIEISITKLLLKQQATLAVAESCSGGLLSSLLTNIAGSSGYFLLSVVTYSNESKTSLLNIPITLIKRYGAVSPQVAKLMAQNVRKIASSDYGIGITGIAGPTGGTIAKPVGTVFIAVAKKNKVITKRFQLSGNRLTVKRKAALKALSILKQLFK